MKRGRERERVLGFKLFGWKGRAGKPTAPFTLETWAASDRVYLMHVKCSCKDDSFCQALGAHVGISGNYLVPRDGKKVHEVDGVTRSSRGAGGISGLGMKRSE